MRAGDAFLYPNEFGVLHLHVILSDPEQSADEIFIVMISSHEYGRDEACLLSANDHPFIRHPSVVIYQMPPALLLTAVELEAWRQSRRYIRKPPVSPSVLARMRRSYLASRYVLDRIEQLLHRQRLLEE